MSEALDEGGRVPRVAIVGGGLVGALNACFFAKRGWNVDLYEFREDIRTLEHVHGRSINLALSHRGREALDHIGLQSHVVNQGVPMHARLVHDPDGTQHALPYGKPGQFIVSTHRRLLNEKLLSEAESYPSVRLFFQHKLLYSKLETAQLVFQRLTDKEEIRTTADLMCGCDGAYSALRRSLMTVPRFDFSQEYIPHGYIELSIQPTKEGQFKLEPNVFHLWPRALVEFFDTNFPDAVPLIGRQEIIETFERVKPSALMSVKCRPHHFGSKMVLLGDAAHAMVPFYGQGMNCGFEDCLVLHECLDKHGNNIGEAIREYSEVRCPDAHAINDLAMYNYLELRDLVNQAGFRLRKKLDFFLNSLFPRTWIPMYSMVTFSRIRYHQVIRDRAWQDKILKRLEVGGVSLLTIACSLAAFWALKSGKVKLPKLNMLRK